MGLKLKSFTPPGPEGMVLAFDSTGINVYTTSGWHQRSRIEAFMNRLKRIFGFYWHNPTTSGCINEMIIKILGPLRASTLQCLAGGDRV